MNSQFAYYDTKLEKAMKPEQFTQIVEAILAGKYSWACLLILRFSGYNPLHYIPYRTYNRLMKENCQVARVDKHKTHLNTSNHHSEANGTSSQKCLSQINDLPYLEVVREQNTKVKGGNLGCLGRCKNQEQNLIKSGSLHYLSDYNL